MKTGLRFIALTINVQNRLLRRDLIIVWPSFFGWTYGALMLLAV